MDHFKQHRMIWQETFDIDGKILEYKKGQAIFTEGEPVVGIYFVLEGAVKVHQSWGSDNEFIIRFATSGDVIGHRGRGVTAFPVSATALENTRVCFINNHRLEALFLKDRAFLYAMMQLYAAELLKAETRMRDLALVPVKGRVADALLTMRSIFGLNGQGYIRVPVTRLDIASYAGTTYEAVFRLLGQWNSEGIVSTSGKYIKINDDKTLGSISNV
jgi:CRP/FNR family transcriptional regulator